MLRFLAIFISQLILWGIVSATNQMIADWQLGLFTGGLFITHIGLTLGHREFLFAGITSGFLFDAASPVPFGEHALVFAVASLLLHSYRNRIAREEKLVQVIFAVVVNALLFVALMLLRRWTLPQPAILWERLLWELGLSSLFISITGVWYHALLDRAIVLSQPPKFKNPQDDD